MTIIMMKMEIVSSQLSIILIGDIAVEIIVGIVLIDLIKKAALPIMGSAAFFYIANTIG